MEVSGIPDKEKSSKNWIFLILLFLFVFSLRMFISLQYDNLTYDSYFDVRQVEHILKTGIPDFNDELSYGGRIIYFSPIYDYIVAFFSLFFSIEIAIKLVSNLGMAFLVVLVYLLSYKIVKNKFSSYAASIISFIIPILFFEGLFSTSVFSIILPLIIYLFYLFIDIDVEKNVYFYIYSSSLLSAIHPISVLFLLTLLIFFIILKISGMKRKEKAIESFLASVFIILWDQLIIFKKAFFNHGVKIIYQNIPSVLLATHYPTVLLIDIMSFLGIVPFVIGCYLAYKYLFKAKNRPVFLVISLAITSLLAIWFRFVEPREGLLLLGLSFSILTSVYFAEIIAYLKITKFDYPRFTILTVLLVTIIFSASFIFLNFDKAQSEIVSNEIINDLKTLKANDEEIKGDKAVVAPIKYGHVITYFSQKPNLIDDNYLLRNDLENRIKDTDNIYISSNQIEVLELFDFYKIGYVLVDEDIKQKYKFLEHPTFYTPECFDVIKGSMLTIYRRKCDLVKT